MANGINDLSLDTLKETVASADKPVLVDFWAEWCGPCKKIAPILEEIAGERSDDFAIAKINIDDHQQAALDYNVMSIPTMIMFKDGEPVGRVTGALSKGALLQEIDGFLATSP